MANTVAAALSAIVRETMKNDPRAFEDALDTVDMWNTESGHNAVPGPRTIKVGPALQMSGAGADQAVADYSNPRPQNGISDLYDRFAQLLKEMSHAGVRAQNAQDDTSYSSKAMDFIGKARIALRKAGIAAVVEKAAEAGYIESARSHIELARLLLAKANDEEDEDDLTDDHDKGMEKAVAALKTVQAKLAKAEGTTATAKSAGALPQVTPEQLARLLANDLKVHEPPDMTSQYLAKAAGPSLSERIDMAIERGELSDHEEIQAQTALQHFNLAKDGRVKISEAMGTLQRSTGRVQALFGLEAVPGHMTLKD